MQVVITAVGPDNRGLADPIIHYVTGAGANIAEIQMYDHDEECLFAMLLRIELAAEAVVELRAAMQAVGREKGLSIRVWSPEERAARPRLCLCTTYRPEPALAVLRALRDGRIKAEAALMIGNRPHCRSLAEQFGVPWHDVGNEQGVADDERLISLCDEHEIDYLILARYMRVLPPSSCWKYAGGRILNLHHGLLPSFPGLRPYHDAYAARMLTFGATCHFIVPELDAGNQIIYQSTFTVPPGLPLEEIIRRGQEDNEPHCLVEGVRRVVDREVQLHFHRVIARQGASAKRGP
ncbi:MAG TPA: formyltransferase family protein [Pirellulales bacterium]|jgi:formyltetrahydrofolate deformylase|nr:formyltransferase family protein [Pirellulales bacterium]